MSNIGKAYGSDMKGGTKYMGHEGVSVGKKKSTKRAKKTSKRKKGDIAELQRYSLWP
jgi:hypothetical protein